SQRHMPRIHARFYAPPLWESHAGGSLASEQIADLDKRHFLAWRPRRLCLLVLLQAGLDDEEQHPCQDDEIDRNSEKIAPGEHRALLLGLVQGRRRADRTFFGPKAATGSSLMR